MVILLVVASIFGTAALVMDEKTPCPPAPACYGLLVSACEEQEQPCDPSRENNE